jgi:hypothetical protein
MLKDSEWFKVEIYEIPEKSLITGDEETVKITSDVSSVFLFLSYKFRARPALPPFIELKRS